MTERPDDPMAQTKMDPASLYREDIYTDRKVGTIRVLTPVKSDGSADASRKVLYVGEAQLYTSVGTLPLSFEVEANTLADAVERYGAAAKDSFERAIRELEEMRRQAASSIVIPKGGAGSFGPGGMPGGGKIQIP